MNRQKIKVCLTPEGVTWSSAKASTIVKLFPNSFCRASKVYLTIGSPLHFEGASGLKVDIIKCPVSLKAWLRESLYPSLSSTSVKKWNTARSCQMYYCSIKLYFVTSASIQWILFDFPPSCNFAFSIAFPEISKTVTFLYPWLRRWLESVEVPPPMSIMLPSVPIPVALISLRDLSGEDWYQPTSVDACFLETRSQWFLWFRLNSLN